MAIAHDPAKPCPTAPVYLSIRPLDPRDGAEWWISLEDDILTLLNPEETSVLQLLRDEAARYVRLRHYVFHGQVLTFVFAGGLKQYSFRVGKEQLSVLLAWLPHKTPREQRRDVRKAGVALSVFAAVYLLLEPFLPLQWGLPWLWGFVLLTAGVLGVVTGEQRCYTFNGLVLVATGLWELFPWTLPGLHPRLVVWQERLIPVTLASLLALWGIQQFSRLTPSQQIRDACAIRDRRASFLPRHSRIVRRLGRLTAGVASFFALYAVIVGIVRFLQPVPPSQTDTLLTDLLVSVAMAALTGGSACMLLLRQRAPYREAKVAGQMVLVSGVFAAWAAGFGLADLLEGGPSAFRGVIGPNVATFALPYAWLLSIPSVLLFNRWYTLAVERELEELRD